jgi:cytochrome c oxidase subunit II
MTMQNDAWVISLAGIGLVSLLFIYVIAQAGKTTPDPGRVQKKAYAFRRPFFWALIILGIGVAYATLKTFPIPKQQGPLHPAQIVQVVGHQWSWQIAPDTIPAGVPIEFDVTSTDVNHGFGIYNAHDRLLTQTQAMPGYTNRLIYTFARPGTYKVLCLEYCGLAHYGMMAELTVVAQKGGQQ